MTQAEKEYYEALKEWKIKIFALIERLSNDNQN